MVTIRKGSKLLSIPNGAYANIYAPAGWVLVSEVKVSDPKDKTPAKEITEPEKETEEVPEDSEEEDVIYVDPEDLLEKPLEELDYEELQILAEYLGISKKGLKSSKALREAIRKVKE